jgi:hypothetical protein
MIPRRLACVSSERMDEAGEVDAQGTWSKGIRLILEGVE